MSDLVDVLLGFFYQNWIYIIIGAAVIITVMGGFGIVWFVYCSDRAKSYKVKPLPRTAQVKEETDSEEMSPCPAQSELNLSALPPPVPELLRSMRRERSRQASIGGDMTSLALDATSPEIQQESGHLVEDEGTIRRENKTISTRTTTLERLRSRSEVNKQRSTDQQDRPSRLELQRSMTLSKKVMTSSEDESSSDVEDNVSLTTKRAEVAKRLSETAPWRSPSIPFRSCDSFVYNKSSAEYREEYRIRNSIPQEETPSSPSSRDDTIPRDVTIPRATTSPQPQLRGTLSTHQGHPKQTNSMSRAAPKVPKTSSPVKHQRSSSIDVIKNSRVDAVKPREMKRSETHGIIRGRPRDLTIPSRDVTTSSSRRSNRVSVDDNRFSTQLSTEELSPKHQNGPMFEALSGQHDVTTRAVAPRDITPRDAVKNLHINRTTSSDQQHLYENNRDTVRKYQNKDMERYAEGFSSPKYATVNKIHNTSESTSRDITKSSRDVTKSSRDITKSSRDVTTIPRNFSYGARGAKQTNTVQAPWAQVPEERVDFSREDNMDYTTSEDNMDPGSANFRGDQFGSVDGRCGSDELSDEFEFMEPTIYANQEAGFHQADL